MLRDKSRAIGLFTFCFSITLTCASAWSDAFPAKPIRILASEAGGAADFTVRVVVVELSHSFSQPVIIDNRVALIATHTAAKAAADGYTLLMTANSFWLGPLLRAAFYDPLRDFKPITTIATEANVLVVHPAVPVSSVQELIALAKAKPGELNYARTAIGGTIHLAAELFNFMAGVKVVAIPYKGTAAAFNGVIAGEVQLMFPAMAIAAPQVKTGKLRALASTRRQSSALLPGLPTLSAAGLPGFDAGNTHGLFAPAHTRDSVIIRLNREVVKILEKPEVRAKFTGFGVDPLPSSPEQFAALMKKDMAAIRKLIKHANIGE